MKSVILHQKIAVNSKTTQILLPLAKQFYIDEQNEVSAKEHTKKSQDKLYKTALENNTDDSEFYAILVTAGFSTRSAGVHTTKYGNMSKNQALKEAVINEQITPAEAAREASKERQQRTNPEALREKQSDKLTGKLEAAAKLSIEDLGHTREEAIARYTRVVDAEITRLVVEHEMLK